MMRKAFWAFLLPLAICGAAWAGGDHCNHEKAAAAGHDHGQGHHCALSKGVSKSAKMTDDGAVVTLKGKNDEAVKAIQEHLSAHTEKGEGSDCPDCPFGMQGVKATVKVTDKGGEVTFSGSTPEAVKSVQEWASKPAGACCGDKEKKKAA
ncbi:MAG: hypothetical protein ACREAA_20395 [Candidatus Polarisedimenticolia bacterium]